MKLIKVRITPLTEDQKYGLMLAACYPFALLVLLASVATAKWMGVW